MSYYFYCICNCILHRYIYSNPSQIVEIVACFPNIALHNYVACQVSAYFYYVASLGNLMTCLSINMYFYVIILKQDLVDWVQINEYHKLELLVFAFPTVMMLVPFMLLGYGDFGYSNYSEEGISICILSHVSTRNIVPFCRFYLRH